MASATFSHAGRGGPATITRPEPSGPNQGKYGWWYAEQHGATAASARCPPAQEPMKSIEWCIAREQLPLPKRNPKYETCSGMFRSYSMTEMRNARPAPENCGSHDNGFGYMGLTPAGKGWGATTSGLHGAVDTGKLMKDGLISGGKSASVMVLVEKERNLHYAPRRAPFGHNSLYKTTICTGNEPRRAKAFSTACTANRNKIDRFFNT